MVCFHLKALCVKIGSFSCFRGVCLYSGSGKLLIVSQLRFAHRLSSFASTFLLHALVDNRCFEERAFAGLFIQGGKRQMGLLCLTIVLSHHSRLQVEVLVDCFLVSIFIYYFLCDCQKVLVAIVHYINIIYCREPINRIISYAFLVLFSTFTAVLHFL